MLQDRTITTGISNKNIGKLKENPEISWRFRDFCLLLPSLNNSNDSYKGDDDARNHIGHYLCLTSETCQRSHYTNSGGHPV